MTANTTISQAQDRITVPAVIMRDVKPKSDISTPHTKTECTCHPDPQQTVLKAGNLPGLKLRAEDESGYIMIAQMGYVTTPTFIRARRRIEQYRLELSDTNPDGEGRYASTHLRHEAIPHLQII